MAASRIKGISIEIDGSTTKLQTALKDVNGKIKSTQDALKDVDKLLKLDPKNVELLRQKQQLLSSAIQETGEKLKTERQALEQLKAGPQTEETIRQQDALAREIIDTENNLKSLTAEYQNFGKEAGEQGKSVLQKMQETGEKIQSFGEGLSSAGSKLTKGITLPLVGIGTVATKTAVDFESAFAGVKKTVDATDEQLEELKQGIIEMSKELPASTTEIAAVAEAAGQLGIKTEDILSFTRTMIDLGESTNLSAEEAASALAKFANVVKMSPDNYNALGSTIVALGNNFATTEADIVSMATRLASTGEVVGLTEPQIMAIATALSSVGIEAEAGGSAVSKLLKQIEVAVQTYGTATETINKTGYSLRDLELMASLDSKAFKGVAGSVGMTTAELQSCMKNASKLNQFADVAGMTAEQFISAWGEDAVGALSAFIGGLNNTEQTGKSAVEILNDMGLTEVRLSNAVLSLASSGGVMTQALNTANEAWGENAALTNEANQRYATTESRIEITKNRLSAVAMELGENLLPLAEWGVSIIGSLADKFSGLSETQQNTILAIGGVVAIAGPALSILGKATSGIGSLVSAGGGLIAKLGSLGGGAKKAAESVGNLAGAAGGAAAPVSNAGGAMGKLSQNALGLVAAGAGILLAATGMALLAQSAVALANAGGPAIAVMGGLIVAVAGMAVGAAALAPALTAGAVGLVAFGGAITLIGVGILAATSGVTLLATQLPNIATDGGKAALALAAIGSTLVLVGIGGLAAAGGVAKMLLPFAGAAVTIGATDLALVGLIATLGLSAAAGGVLSVALSAISVQTRSIATDATAAGAALIAMTTSVNVISAAMDGFKAIIKDAAAWFVGIFEKSKPTATKAAEQMAESAMQGMSRKMTDGTGAMNQKWTAALAEIEKRSSDSFGKIKNGISADMGDMTKSVRQNLDEIQRSFGGIKFELGKNIKLPHFSLNGKFDPESGTVPTVSVRWYRKAYDDAYILNGATIFGAMNGQYLGGGEGHGSELVVGTDKLMRMISEASRGGGVTQNLTINAPQRLSAHEVARQTRLANRQLVLSLGGR